jgi:hypothetical protein
MKKRALPDVCCVYAKEGKRLAEIIEESFRLYLRRILAESGDAAIQ